MGNSHNTLKICFVTTRYPVEGYPVNTFLEQLVSAIAKMGIECYVIAPYSRTHDKFTGKNYFAKPISSRCYDGNNVKVFCPRMLTPTSKRILGIPFSKIFLKEFQNKVEKTLKKNRINPDVLYAHFIKPSGLAVADIGRKYGVSSFVAYGESSLNLISGFDKDFLEERLSNLSGVVAVSTKNKIDLSNSGIVEESKIEVFPNAIDNAVFRKLDKHKVRMELGFSQEDFIVAFTGHFINRKGSRRLSDALEQLPGVKSIFIGSGEEPPTCEGVLFQGRLNHVDVCKYLNAADVFVLPTLAEGCCNAIIEAMACGLPIISSNLPFNDDILDDSCSIRINPENVNEIKNAILKIRKNPEMRLKMSNAALVKAESLNINERAQRIVDFIRNRKI